MNATKNKYWIIVATKDHVQNALQQGIAQACHGKTSPLRRMQKNDLVVFYSAKQTMGKPQVCQAFTAIGEVADDDIYHVQLSDNFCPSRRAIDFLPAREVSILPLIAELNFIKNKKSWGFPFRYGFFEIQKEDFNLIAETMLNDHE